MMYAATVSASSVSDAHSYYIVVPGEGRSIEDEVNSCEGMRLFKTLDDAMECMNDEYLYCYDEVQIYKVLALPCGKYRSGWTLVEE